MVLCTDPPTHFHCIHLYDCCFSSKMYSNLSWPFHINCSTVNFVTVVFYCSRLSYHQFLIENIPEGLHSLLPVAPAPNYRFTEEQGINFKFLVLQSLTRFDFLKCILTYLFCMWVLSPNAKTSLVSHYHIKQSVRRTGLRNLIGTNLTHIQTNLQIYRLTL